MSSNGATVTPGASSGTTNSAGPASVLASTKATCESEKLIDDFSPRMANPSPDADATGLAVAASAEMSDPVPGSVSASPKVVSPVVTRGSHCAFTRSEPRRHNIFPAVPAWMTMRAVV